jgi:dipeptidyl-peptidase-4
MNMNSRTMLCALCVVAGVVMVGAEAAAQQPGEAMLKRIFASSEFAGERFGPARWLDGGSYVLTERSEEPRGSNLVKVDAATGAREVLVTARQLVPPGDSVALPVEGFTFSDDLSKLLVFTNSRKVWRQNTRGDYWLLDRSVGTLRKLGGPDASESSLMFAKLSPTADRVAYVREGNLYVERLADGAITRLTSDGNDSLVNGTSDWVYEEELDLRDGFRWSPDGGRIAFWRFDMSGVRSFTLLDNTDSLYPFTTTFKYPKVGTTNSAVSAGVVGAAGGAITWLALPGDARNDYLPRMEWVDASALALQRMNRRQNVDHVLLADPATGATREIFTERDSAWLDVVDDWEWLDAGRRVLWVSERDGWRHLYTVSRDGRETKLLTPGDYDVVSVLKLDAKGGWIYIIASPDNAAQRYLYRVPLKGGRAARLTPEDQPGTHSYSISPDARFAIHSYSAFDLAPQTELVRLPSHQVVRVLASREKAQQAVAPLLHRPTEFFKVRVPDGTMLDGWMILPGDFDPAKHYPMLMYVYTEPAGQTVRDAWLGGGGGLWFRTLADMGYVVASVDNRGTPGPRGRAWRTVVYGQLGVLSSRDQADAVRQLTRTRPYLDSARVGVWGWSGGGTATLQAMFRYPDVYQVGMAVASVPDETLYDTIYQERYFGLLPQDSLNYQRASAINQAEGLAGKLLIVHGTGDDNVHWQGAERLVNRLVALGKRFDYMTYPNRTHCICEGPGTTLHVYSLLTRYLVEHLPAGGR